MATLYVLQAKGTDMYKIGVTRVDVDYRVSQLKVASPFPLDVVCAHTVKEVFELEKFFHRYFHPKHLRGEWFRLNEEDLDFIQKHSNDPSRSIPEDDFQEEEVSHEKQGPQGQEGLESRISSPVRSPAFYIVCACLGLIGFVIIDSSTQIIVREYFSEFWFVAFVVTLILLIVSRRELAQEQWQRGLAECTTGNQMLSYMGEVLSNPGRVASSIRSENKDLARRLARGRVRTRTELFMCVAFLILVVEGRTITHDWVRISLDRLFKSNNWNWPDSVEGWKEHIEDRPAE